MINYYIVFNLPEWFIHCDPDYIFKV